MHDIVKLGKIFRCSFFLKQI